MKMNRGGNQKRNVISLILPILVVPNDMLWQVNYTSDGTRQGAPKRVDRISYFVGSSNGLGFALAHLEFVTFNGMADLLAGALIPGNEWFPQSAIDLVFHRRRPSYLKQWS